MRYSLIAEQGFNSLSEAEKARICNGAGAANDWKSKLIPNTLYGLDCTQAFDIHDHAYHVGITYEDKCRADMNMLINLIRLINYDGGWLSFLRRHRAVTYYEAVHDFGDDAFFTMQKGNFIEMQDPKDVVIYGKAK